jgi:UDP-N-acetylmuramate--alanine ligase
VTAEALAARIRAFGHKGAYYVGSMEHGIQSVAEEAHPGDAIVTLGAGSVSQAGEEILSRLKGMSEKG